MKKTTKRAFYALLAALVAALLIFTPAFANDGPGYPTTVIPTANGGQLTVSPGDVSGTTISCRISGWDGNSETGTVSIDMVTILDVDIPPFPPEFSGLPEAERIAAERTWINDRISIITRPEIWPCFRAAFEQQVRQELREK